METNILRHVPGDLTQRAEVWGTNLLVGLLIFLGFLVASMIVKKVIVRFEKHSDPQKEQLFMLIGDVARTTLIILGTITALGTMGINVSALVAGLGLTGFALGFAFHDALSNFLAGVMILMYHPFRRGDHVEVAGIAGGLSGEVTGIDLRYTTLQNEGKRFLIPNSLLLTNAISVNRL
jgi:small conductance mechanosensitive channel